jgi:carbonic anhydrase
MNLRKDYTPQRALELLKEGNKRFILGKTLRRDFLKQVRETSSSQFPYAAILSCMDSRIPTEIIFDQGLGDIFNIRIAGNVADKNIIGSLEFCCKTIGSCLVLVMGHTDCGAIKGAVDDIKLGMLTGLLDIIKPAINSVEINAERSSGNKIFIDMAAEANVRMTIKLIRDKSPVLKEMENNGELKITGAMYDTSTGEVDFFEKLI